MSFLNWIQQYPALSLLFVFIVAFGESLALIGMIVPGAILMVSFGALIAANILPFWPTVLVAFIGAIAGDGLSYYLGAHYHHHLAQIWPLSRYPDLIPRGEAFFKRHGAKSVLLGRFFGPLRAIIPAVAGMLGMSRIRFLIVNIISAALWAPIYLLPGIIFAASLELASEMTARIALFVLFILISILLLAWLVKHIYLLTAPRMEHSTLKLMHWIEHHPQLGRIPGSIINPKQSDVLGLAVIGIVLFTAIISLSLLLQWIAHWPLVNNLDLVLAELLNELHHPLLDDLMLMISTLGNLYFLATIFIIFTLWKMTTASRRDTWVVITHCLAASVLPILVIAVIPLILTLASPEGVTLSFLPNGKLMLAVSLYGFISIYLVQFVSQGKKWFIYFIASIVTFLIAVSHLYVQGSGMIGVLTGYIAGLLWIALLGLALRRHAISDSPIRLMQWLLLLAMCLPIFFAYPVIYRQQAENLPIDKQTQYELSSANWKDTGWTALPQSRHDLRGYNQHPFNIQWSNTAETISSIMKKAGWSKPENNKLQFIQWLNPGATLEQLFVMPHVHDGRYENLLWVTTTGNGNLTVLRLWESSIVIKNGVESNPLWYGTVSTLERTNRWGLTYLRTHEDFEKPIRLLKSVIKICNINQKIHVQKDVTVEDNQVLLISDCNLN